MDAYLSPVDVASHWPFIERHLNLSRWEPARKGLSLLAQLQVEGQGCPVDLGRARLVADGLTAGESGGVWRALKELEARGVVARFRGAGRRPDAWTWRGDIGHWRRMPWVRSGPDVERTVFGCVCRAEIAVAARNPGQGLALRRERAYFHISAEDHLFRPGLFLVDSRGNGDLRAATANSPAWGPVDSRGNGEGPRPLTALSVEVELLQLSEAERSRFERLKTVVDFHCTTGSGVWAGTTLERTLTAMARALSDEECKLTIDHFDRHARQALAPGQVSKIERYGREIQANQAKPRRLAPAQDPLGVAAEA